jgi:hypothetical protein
MRIASATVPVVTRILNGFSDGSCHYPNSVACFRKQEVNKPPVGFLICFFLPSQHTIMNRVFPSCFSAFAFIALPLSFLLVKTATEVGVRAIQDHKVIEWNTCWKCRLSEGTDDM